MTKRQRLRNGASATRGDFYCRYGQHYVNPIYFENDPDNKGICLDCAFSIIELMNKHMYVPENDVVQGLRAREAWQAAKDAQSEVVRLRAGSNDPGWVYYVEQGGLIKLGYSLQPRTRMKAYGPTAQLLAIHPGTPALEHQLHLKFRDSLARGREWFNPTDDLRGHIASVLAQHGDPSVFAYQYTTPKSQEETVRAMFATREFLAVADGAHSAL